MIYTQPKSGGPSKEFSDGKVPGGRYHIISIKDESRVVDLTRVFCTGTISIDNIYFYNDCIHLCDKVIPGTTMVASEGRLLTEIIEHPYLNQMFAVGTRIETMVRSHSDTVIFTDSPCPLVEAKMWRLVFGNERR